MNFVYFGIALCVWIGGVLLLYAAERWKLLLIPAIILMISSVLIVWHLYTSTESGISQGQWPPVPEKVAGRLAME